MTMTSLCRGKPMSLSNFGKRAALAAAGAGLAVGLSVGVAPTAQSAEQWGGIATGPGGEWQLWWGKNSRTEAAYFGNWARCGAQCKRVLLFSQCGALAFNGGAFSPAEGGTQQDAEEAALNDLPGGWIVASRCNDGSYGQINWQNS
jgi:hypothetical protein